MNENLNLRAGEWVEVRSKYEILSTLDQQSQFDGLPFMPEMFAFCGSRLQVYKRAHKTCDTVFPVRGRRMANAVHLATRCDGQAHGGCQANCLIFWKEIWLKRAADPSKSGTRAAFAPHLIESRHAADHRPGAEILRPLQGTEDRQYRQGRAAGYGVQAAKRRAGSGGASAGGLGGFAEYPTDGFAEHPTSNIQFFPRGSRVW